MRWEKNKKVLRNIIEEQINELQMHDYFTMIIQRFDDITHTFYKKQFEYPNMTEVNKGILKEVHNFINEIRRQRVKSVPQSSNTADTAQVAFHHNPSYIKDEYTRESIQLSREDYLQRQMEEKKRELDKYTNKRPPEVVDFTDKEDENMTSIDDLLEREMNKRKNELDFYKTGEDTMKSAEDWIHDSTPHVMNQSNIVPSQGPQQPRPITLKISDQNAKLDEGSIKKIAKKVTFEDQPRNTIIQSEPPRPPPPTINAERTDKNILKDKFKSILGGNSTSIQSTPLQTERKATDMYALLNRMQGLEGRFKKMEETLAQILTRLNQSI